MKNSCIKKWLNSKFFPSNHKGAAIINPTSAKRNKKIYNAIIIIILLGLFMIMTEYQLAVVPKVSKFVSVLQDVLSAFQPTISKNVSDIRLILWTRKSPQKYDTLTLGELVCIF